MDTVVGQEEETEEMTDELCENEDLENRNIQKTNTGLSSQKGCYLFD